MHYLVLGAIVTVQLTLAVHAYNRGRVSPWMWLILFFPVVGSLLYALIYLIPSPVESSKSSRSPSTWRDDERPLRPLPLGPFAAVGDRPDNAVVVGSAAEIEPRAIRERCPECEAQLTIDEHLAEKVAGRDLRVLVMKCRRCSATPVRYYALERAQLAS